MRVLVLGGNRYIGLQLVFELARQGHEVTVFNSHAAALPEGARRIHGDRHAPGVIETALGPLRDTFDAIFDNTAYTPEQLSRTIALFRRRVKHFVFTSSIAVYRWADALPVTEEEAVAEAPDERFYGSYGYDKVRCEAVLAREHVENGLPFTVLRVAHSLGPMSPVASREPGAFKRLEEGRPLLLAGRTEAIVHFVHVLDAARAMAAVLGKERAVGRTYNVAGADYCSIATYMRLMAATVGVSADIRTMPAGLPGAMRSPVVHWLEARHGSMIFSIERAKVELGWTPRFTLRSGLADSYRWFREEGRGRYAYDFSPDEAILTEMARRDPNAPADATDGVRLFQS